MSQKTPQRRALTRIPAAGARSWSGYIPCVDGGWIMPCMKGARTAPPACEAVFLTGSRDGLGTAESGDPCRQSRTSILPVIGLLSPARVRRMMTNFLPIAEDAPIATLFQYVLANSYDNNPPDTAEGASTVPYPAVFLIRQRGKTGCPPGMKPRQTGGEQRTEPPSRQGRAAQIDPNRLASPRPVSRNCCMRRVSLRSSRIRFVATLHS
jgi:hypothetical protein